MGSEAPHYDVIVIGVGGMGSATVYQLARRGFDVLGLEQFDIPHQRGSSHGGSRVFRLAQHEHPEYVPLAKRAKELWTQLGKTTDRNIFHQTGSIHAGPEESDYLEDTRRSCERNDLQYQSLDARELTEKFPGYELPDGFECIYQPGGGFLDPENCIAAHVDAAQKEGATIQGREQVLDWAPTAEGGVRVTTGKNTYRSDKLVVTAGAWTGKSLPELEKWLKPQRRIMGWFQPNEPVHFQPTNFPTFNIEGRQSHVYGVPLYKNPGFKIGRTPPVPEVINPDDSHREPTHQEEELLRRELSQYFPSGAGPTLSLRTCIVTKSRDGHFIIGNLPQHEQIYIASGFSGHGFKFCTAIGEALSELVVNSESTHLPNIFDISRIFDNKT